MGECIELMVRVQTALSQGAIRLPLRSSVALTDPATHLLLMPGSLPDPPVFGAKLLSLFPDNPQRVDPAPAIQGHVLLFDGDTGRPLALVEAASLTAIRTAAASAAATRILANPDAGCLALLGYGVQAHSHLLAMRAVRPVREVRVWGPDPARAAAFAEQYGEDPALSIQVADSASAAVRDADLICAVSGSRTPIVLGEALSPGCHVNLVGAAMPDSREADGTAMARGRLFTEVTEFALAEAGDILLAMNEGSIDAGQIAGEIGQVFDGRVAGRESPHQITIYKSLGNTAQDLIAAHHVWAGARGPNLA